MKLYTEDELERAFENGISAGHPLSREKFDISEYETVTLQNAAKQLIPEFIKMLSEQYSVGIENVVICMNLGELVAFDYNEDRVNPWEALEIVSRT